MKLRFDPDGDLVLVTALLEMNDEVAVLRLALDTGANFSVLTPAVFENMGQNVPPALENYILATASGLVEAVLVEVESLSALGISRSDFRVAVHSLPDVLDLDGVLGLDFLRHQRLVLDFRSGEIELN